MILLPIINFMILLYNGNLAIHHAAEISLPNGRFDAQMPGHNGVFVTYTLVVPDFWLMAVENKNSNKETYFAYKNCKDINVAVKGREVPCTDWPTYVAVVRKIFENFKSARQQLALAVEKTDLSAEEAAEEGRGRRPKRPPARYGQSSMEESFQDSSNDQEDASHVLANCPSFPNTTRGFYTSTQNSSSVVTQDSSQSSNLPCHINDAEQAAVGVGTPRCVICQQGSDSLELGSVSVGVGEDSQLDSQLINSLTLSDSSDNEPIDNPGPVIRRPLPAIANRPPFPSTTSRPATTGVAYYSSTLPYGDIHSVAPVRSLALQKADVILVLGARLNWILHFGRPPRFDSKVKIIQVDILPEEVHNSAQSSVALVGDIGDLGQ
ncbi:hypothetical protein DAPPUDRAFT_253560 [Daphnia pulex]|uniref:Thiamine pyrophosphate enzyme central domain-containing protein n=1 Tax=Daphnia pulex TaxID=6669 RepID=E9H540_DAPPU|nr:hypothetical protein DAPPUDRAFT_253560 [Daphnia pulex]|eukprot:EFX73064.1 hypothetical protein DAPPUDRAFT_253560 [Daphnia pulex]